LSYGHHFRIAGSRNGTRATGRNRVWDFSGKFPKQKRNLGELTAEGQFGHFRGGGGVEHIHDPLVGGFPSGAHDHRVFVAELSDVFFKLVPEGLKVLVVLVSIDRVVGRHDAVAEISMMKGVVGGPADCTPLGRFIASSFSTTCTPALAMKKSIKTKTTSTMGAIWNPMSPSSDPTEPAILSCSV